MEKYIVRLNEIQRQMELNREDAKEICVAEGYPSNGSNYELRVESLNSALNEELEDILEICDAVLVDGTWVLGN